MPRLVSLFTVLLTVSAFSAGAQSLAEVARKEEARRDKIKHTSKVYTNTDLKPAARWSGAPSPGSAASEPAEPGEKPADEKADTAAQDEDARAKDEQQWRARMAEARTALDRSKTFAEALQSRINGLYADFTARDDPAQRGAIERERQKNIAELERVKSEIQAQTKAIADLEEEARRAGVPPGWLR
jgi:hypothetical protein